MIKKFIIVTLLSVGANASLFDFLTVKKAQEAYDNKAYAKAEKLYQNLEGDEARFNEADALYHQKHYKEALAKYGEVKSEKLSFKKLYNMGNSYAQLKKIDEAIESYEKALKIKDDADARHNLELLKKKKKEQKKKQNKKNNKKDDKKQKDKDKKNKDKKEQDKKEQDKKQKEGGKDSDKQKDAQKNKPMNPKDKKSDAQKKEEQKKQEAQKKKEAQKQKDKEQEKKEKEKEKQQEAKATAQAQKNTPISKMEERKWQKMLNKRGVNTLMIPLPNKGEKRNETNPW